MTDAPAVSVLMPVYNAAAYVAEAAESVLAQTYRDFELLAVDDGATDGSGAILDAVAARDPRVRVIHQPNRGLVRSLNRAADEARGRYLARMDADDVAEPDRLARQVAFLDARPGVVAVGGAILRFGTSAPKRQDYPLADAELRSQLEHGSPFAHPAVTMRRDAFLAAGGYRPAFFHAEDYDLWFRLAERGELANLPDVVLRYRTHAEQRSRSVRDLAVHTLAAQAAARARRATGRDPLDGVDRVTEAVLYTLGPTPADVEVQALVTHLAVAYQQADDGRFAAAIEHARLAEAAMTLPAVRRDHAGRPAAAIARFHYRSGWRGWPRAAAYGAKAVLERAGRKAVRRA